MTVDLKSPINSNIYLRNLPTSANKCSFQANPHLNMQSDTFESSEKKKKNKKWIWSIGSFLIAATGIITFIRYKHLPPKIQHLEENMELQKFKTVEEAIQFAKDKFGIKLEANNNLKLATFVNNRLINYNNKMKGQVVLPKKIIFKQNMKTINGDDALMGWSNWGDLHINEKLATEHLESNNLGRFQYLMKAIFHELGHANHQAVCKDYEKMGNLKELKALFIKDRHYYDEFMNDIKSNKVIKDFCGEYALTSPAEFVADVFAYKIMDKDIPQEVERLYKKYGGRDVPK